MFDLLAQPPNSAIARKTQIMMALPISSTREVESPPLRCGGIDSNAGPLAAWLSHREAAPDAHNVAAVSLRVDARTCVRRDVVDVAGRESVSMRGLHGWV